MKTVFKVGMEVWDKTISPNKGKVIEVLKDTRYDFPIKVEFNDGLKIKYTNEGCFVKSKGAINTLSTVDYIGKERNKQFLPLVKQGKKSFLTV